MDWYCHRCKNFLQFVVIQTVKGFSIVNEAEVDVFLEFSFLFYDPTHICNLISGSSAFSKSSLHIWKFSVQVLLKPSLKNFEHYLASMWNECSFMVIWTFFGIAFLWDWNENWPFPVLWPLLSFPNLLAYWVEHFHSYKILEFVTSSLYIPLMYEFAFSHPFCCNPTSLAPVIPDNSLLSCCQWGLSKL